MLSPRLCAHLLSDLSAVHAAANHHPWLSGDWLSRRLGDRKCLAISIVSGIPQILKFRTSRCCSVSAGGGGGRLGGSRGGGSGGYP